MSFNRKKQGEDVISREIYDTLRGRINEWKYLPGQRLTEDEISSEFNVSRIPVREALHMLIENGYVAKEAYKGYHVTNIDIKQIRDLYEVRLALEVYAVSVAAQKMRDEDWQGLYDFWSKFPDPLSEEANSLADQDEKFHLTIAQQTGNHQFLETLTRIFERLRIIRIYDFSSQDRVITTYQQHRLVLECLKTHNTQAAQMAITENIRITENEVEKLVAHALSQAYLRMLQS